MIEAKQRSLLVLLSGRRSKAMLQAQQMGAQGIAGLPAKGCNLYSPSKVDRIWGIYGHLIRALGIPSSVYLRRTLPSSLEPLSWLMAVPWLPAALLLALTMSS